MKTWMFLFLLIICNKIIFTQINKFNSPDLNLIYIDKSYSYIVPHTARTFQNAMTFHKRFWNYKPSEDVSILLNDFSDIGNGGTLTIPWNMISIGIAPFEYTFDVMPSNERMQWLMNHELTHTVMTDMASSSDNFFRSIFLGKVSPDPVNPASMLYSYLTTPRWYSPRWFHEGIAVFMETWMSGGMGRVLGGYDEMVFRTMVKDSAYFYRVVGLETEGTTIDFQVGVNSYLYGTRFISYLAYTYGIDKLKDFYSRTNSSDRFYASQFRNIYGVSVEDEWEKWIKWEYNFQNSNLETVKKYPLTQNKYLTSFPLGSVSRSFFDKDERTIIAAVNYPGKLSHIISLNIDSGKMGKIAEVPSPALYYVTSLMYDDSSKTIFVSSNNQNWRGLNSIDLKTGEEKELVDYSRTGDFAFNKEDKSLWGIQNATGRSSIVRFFYPYDNFEEVYTIPYGKSFFDIDISSNGKYLSGTLSDVTGTQKLVIFNIDSLNQGIYDYDDIYEFEDNSSSNFVFSTDNKYLIGTSYYTGISNVFRINIKDKKAELLTNTDIGYFRPVPISDDSLFVYEYTTNGLMPCLIKTEPVNDAEAITYLGQKVKEINPVVETWMLPPPSEINIDSVKSFEGNYSELSGIKLASGYPLVEGYKDFIAYGMRFNFMDPIGLHSFNLSLSYSPVKLIPEKERIHLLLKYNYWDWEIKAAYNKADFYDIFGPTKFSRAGYFYSLKYQKDLIYIKPEHLSYSVSVSAYGDLEKLPDYQNINVSFDKLYTSLININHSYLRKSLGAVEYEQGYDWNIYSYTSLINKQVYPKIYSDFSLGFLLPLKNSSLWLRTSAGNAFGDRTNPFNNFYFGGFGNNYVDHLQPQRFREMESFPGAEINEIGGKNFGKLMVEWNLSPIRFRRLGFLSLYSTYTRLSLFGMGLVTDFDRSDLKKKYFSTGAQLDFEIVLFSLLKSTLSFGYGRTFREAYSPSNEFMVSLKLL